MSLVVISDDGELLEVRNVLREMGISFVEDPGSTDAAPTDGESVSLRIASAARFLVRGSQQARGASAATIVIGAQLSRGLEALLDRSDCDYVLKGEVHPIVLRLLIEHTLYEGPRRRRNPRVPTEGQVKLRTGWRSTQAMLTQLSTQGCGVLATTKLAEGDSLRVGFPPALTGAEALELAAHVVGTRALGDRRRELALVFDGGLGERHRKLLRAMMNGCALGRAVGPDPSPPGPTAARRTPPVRGERPVAPPDAASASPGRDRRTGSDRREGSRRRYEQRVLASASAGSCSLLGRDLSCHGMRVAADADVALGDEFKLAIYGPRGQAPVVVRARADRDDGARGVFLRFLDVCDTTAGRLATLVEALPVEATARRRRGAVAVTERLS